MRVLKVVITVNIRNFWSPFFHDTRVKELP